MMTPNLLDEIIRSLDPEQLPVEYLVEARIIDFDGNQRVIRGEELAEFMKEPFDHAQEVRIRLDVPKIRKAIIDEVNAIYDEVNKLYEKEFGDK